jgi:hypothetical protein
MNKFTSITGEEIVACFHVPALGITMTDLSDCSLILSRVSRLGLPE